MKRTVHGSASIGILASSLLIGAASLAGATGGYFAHGYGTQAKGMAGAGVALSTSSLAPATNPALLAFADGRIDVGVALFAPDREYTVRGNPSGVQGTFGLAPGSVTSGSKQFAVPSFGMNWKLDELSRLGLALYGNGGMNTDYDVPTFGTTNAGVDLMQGFIAPTYARRLRDRHAFGLTPILAMQSFEACGLAAFAPMSSDAGALCDRGRDLSYGYGARLGYAGNWAPWFSVGASYQTRLDMSRFEDYQGLFAEKGDFDIPSNWTVGVAVRPLPVLAVAFDAQRIAYSEVASVGHTLLPNLMQSALGADAGAGFGWEDMTIWKTGVQYDPTSAWSFRGGYSYGEQPIRESEVLMNILAPGVIEQHATFGLSHVFDSGLGVHAATTRAFSKTVTGANPLEAPGQQTIDLRMDQWDVDLSISFGL